MLEQGAISAGSNPNGHWSKCWTLSETEAGFEYFKKFKRVIKRPEEKSPYSYTLDLEFREDVKAYFSPSR
jgi:hypothetical protein